MPGQDGSGPRGEGSLTGRGLGPCGRGLARRRGFGRGLGLGTGRAYPRVITEKQEKEILEGELKAVEEDKKEIEKRLKELK